MLILFFSHISIVNIQVIILVREAISKDIFELAAANKYFAFFSGGPTLKCS